MILSHFYAQSLLNRAYSNGVAYSVRSRLSDGLNGLHYGFPSEAPKRNGEQHWHNKGNRAMRRIRSMLSMNEFDTLVYLESKGFGEPSKAIVNLP